jgi:hypothetical protein
MRGFSLIALEKQTPDIASSGFDLVPLGKSFAVSLPDESIWTLSRVKGW